MIARAVTSISSLWPNGRVGAGLPRFSSVTDRFAWLSAIAALSLAIGATAVKASDEDTGPKLNLSQATHVMQSFGACLSVRHPETAKVLATLPGSDDEAAIISKASKPDCLDNDRASMLRFNPHAIRGPLAEGFLKRDFDIATGIQRRAVAARTFPLVDEATLEQQPPLFAVVLRRLAFGQCVEKGDPVGTLAVFKTKVESAEERVALAALQPALGKCLEAGRSMKMSRFELRGYLAEGSYRNLASGNVHD